MGTSENGFQELSTCPQSPSEIDKFRLTFFGDKWIFGGQVETMKTKHLTLF